MTNIRRNAFLNQLRHGVDLKNTKLNDLLNLTDDQKSSLMDLDRNKDNILIGDELKDLFRFVDKLDINGSANSFSVGGKAHNLYEALLAGTKSGPYHGDSIADAAEKRVQKNASGYSYENSPTSPFSNLSGNKIPGTTCPNWLKKENKCNQFVGDTLTDAGLSMPTFTMKDGTEHYMNAENLPFQFDHFDRVISTDDIKKGDIIVVDHPASGDSTAHTEVVTGTKPLRTTGAHFDGAYERDWSALFDNTTPNAAERCWEEPGGDKIYVLRPTKKN